MDFENSNNIFPASDWFDSNFFGDFLSSDANIIKEFNEKTYKIADERLSSRLLNHWYEVGLVNDDRPNGKGWKKFSFSEIVWVKIIFKLRSFGLNLSRIKIVKDNIDKYNSSDSFSDCALLDFYIFVVLQFSFPVKFIVFESGQAEIVRQTDIDLANHIKSITEDFISIDLNKMVNSLLKSKHIKTDYLTYNKLPQTPLIKQIEKSLSAEDIQSIVIKVKDYIVDEKFFTKDRAKANAIISLLNYGEIVERKEGSRSTFQVTNKKKIQK